MDKFTGRLYTLMPCYFNSKAELSFFLKQLLTVSQQDADDTFYIDEAEQRIADEVAERSSRTFARGYLGSYAFSFYGKSEQDKHCVKQQGRVYYTLNKRTMLCVLTIVFQVDAKPVTQFLDRISREALEIAFDDESNLDFYHYLTTVWGLGVVGKSRVCLSTGQTVAEELKPSIFAAEMYASDVMESAALLANFGGGGWRHNIAIYDSSQIYASHTVVLRCDTTLDNQSCLANSEQARCAYHNAVRRDLMLTFIIEILMFREASIKRANIRVKESIQQDEQLSLSDINELMEDFKSAILFWDLDIFLYPTAQQLADTLNTQFDIDRSLDTYHKNQGFLEQRVNLSSAIEAEKETRTINYIAIIVFFFEAIRLLFSVARAVIRKEPIPLEFIYSSGIAFSGSVLLFMLILLLGKVRQLRVKRRR